MRDYSIYLEQMLEMIGKLKRSNLNNLETDDDLFDATIMRLQVIGESASKISAEIRGKHSHILWATLIKTRDFVSHNYEKIDVNIMRALIEGKILPAEKDLKRLFGEVDFDGM